jgi:hypothetical protein
MHDEFGSISHLANRAKIGRAAPFGVPLEVASDMAGEEVTKPREPSLFQQQLSVLVDDADFCLSAARERYDDPKLHGLLVPVAEAAVWDAVEVIEEQSLALGGFSEARLEELSLPTLVLQLKSALRTFQVRLEGLDPESPTETILKTCCVVVGELRRGVVALEVRMSRLFGVPPTQSTYGQLDRGLALRRLFVRFDRAVRGLENNEMRDELVDKLLDNLAESESWKHARPLDHWRMSSLRAARANGDHDWSSITAFARTLRQIGRRVEICDHDLDLLRGHLDAVRARSVAEKIDDSFLSRLDSIRYISDDLDEIYRRGTSATFGEWKYLLEMAADLIADAPNRDVTQKTSEFPLPDELA